MFAVGFLFCLLVFLAVSCSVPGLSVLAVAVAVFLVSLGASLLIVLCVRVVCAFVWWVCVCVSRVSVHVWSQVPAKLGEN